tara:strand:- start:477 stop:944 length:468 start_codon:yes stop_codon:yes gene_type:complete
MSIEATRSSISTAIQTAITSNGYSSETIEWPNSRKGGQPVDGRWWRITILTGQRQPVTIGGAGQRKTRTPFVVTIQLFLPEKGGTKVAYEIATKLGLGTDGLDYQATAAVTDTSISPNQRVHLNWQTLGIEAVGLQEGHFQFNLNISGTANAVDV